VSAAAAPCQLPVYEHDDAYLDEARAGVMAAALASTDGNGDVASIPSPLRRVHQRMKRLAELDDDDEDDTYELEYGGMLGGGSAGAALGRRRELPLVHFTMTHKPAAAAERRYVSPPDQAGLEMQRIIGFNGRGHHTAVWHASSGLFAYSVGVVVVIEHLGSRRQHHLLGHSQQISALAVNRSGTLLASAQALPDPHRRMAGVLVWDLASGELLHVLMYHDQGVQDIAFSCDDRYLASIGNYADNALCVWQLGTGQIVGSAKLARVTHAVAWDASVSTEFVTTGEGGVTFWMLDEAGALKCHTPPSPDLGTEAASAAEPDVHFTCAAYDSESLLIVGTSVGVVTLWSTATNEPLHSFPAHDGEVKCVCWLHTGLVTGGVQPHVRIWQKSGQMEWTVTEQLQLDAPPSSLWFDVKGVDGVIGTAKGTIWHVNCLSQARTRLVSSHMAEIHHTTFHRTEKYVASSSEDGTSLACSLGVLRRHALSA
jgi:WD40 repeat protein